MTNRLVVMATIFLVAGCALSPAGASTRPTNSASPAATISPTSTPIPTASARATDGPWFYVRGYYTQSIPPQYTFTWLPPVTISDYTYINGNVAVPAIYPGPLMIMPVASAITNAGKQVIADRARELGLLNGDGDFSGGQAMPGARVVNIDLIIDGAAYHLVGPDQTPPCDPAMCQPGTPQAFGTFWNQLLTLDSWIPNELGKSEQYAPERVALRLEKSANPPTMSPKPTLVEWPLDVPLADATCLTLSGEDLATMLPILESATQLTALYEGSVVAQPYARVLVPGEPDPCATDVGASTAPR